MTRVAAALLWFNGLGFGVCCLPGIVNLSRGKDIPMILGFPAYGRGPFERIGIRTTVPLLIAFLLVCSLEVVAGWLLWGGSKAGAIIALAALPAGAVFWWGFELPIPWILAVGRTVLILLDWRALE